MSVYKRTVKHTLIYAIGLIMNRSIHLLLLPFYTRNLDAATDYALFELATPLILFVVPVFELGIATGLMRFYHKPEYFDEESRIRLFSTSVLFLLLFSVLGNGLLFFVSPWVAKLLFGSADYADLVLISGILASITVLGNQPLALMRSQERSGTYITICFARTLFGPLVILYFLFFSDLGVYGVLYGDIIGLFAMMVAGLLLSKKWLRFRFDPGLLKQLLLFSSPLTIGAIAAIINTMLDRVFLREMLGEEVTAIYAVGFRAAMIFTFTTRAFQIAWPATAFQLDNHPDSKQIIAAMYEKVLLCMCLVSFLLTIISPELVMIMAPQELYGEAFKIVPLITIAYIFHMSSHYFNTNLAARGKTFQTSMVISFSCLIKIVITAFLISRFGVMGAALSTFIAFFSEALMANLLSQYHDFIAYRYGKILFIFVLTLLLSVLSVQVSLCLMYHWSVLARMLLILLYGALLLIFRIVLWQDLIQLQQFVFKKLRLIN